MEQKQDAEYAGFWVRLMSAVLDALLLFLIIVPVLYSIHGSTYFRSDILNRGFLDILNSLVFPSLLVILSWVVFSSTPGKLLFSLKIVDAKTGGKPKCRQYIVRYLGYYLSFLLLGIGFFMIAFRPRKQALHDMLAGTVVVRNPPPTDNPEDRSRSV